MSPSILFKPFESAKLRLRNRILMAPMTRRFSPGGIPDAKVASYYRRRAEGGVGLLITEGTTIARPAASDHDSIPNLHDPASLVGWKSVVEAVHDAGGKIASQIWHQGLVRHQGTGPYPDARSEGPSGTEDSNQTMSDTDIADTIDAFASAAINAQRVGFDAVEVHAAHGYLIDQFMWHATNRRTDSYGGDLQGRVRFAVEVVKAIRRGVGQDFPIIFRYSQWKLQDYSARLAASPQELGKILAPLTDAGVDIFHASTRRFWEPEYPGSELNLAGWTRLLTGRPAISVGSVGLAGDDFMDQLRGQSSGATVGSLDNLLNRMNHHEFDLIAVGRALISDPDWPSKVRDQQHSSMIPFDKKLLGQLV